MPSADEKVQGLTTWQVQIYKLRGHTETDHPEVDKEVPEIIFKVKWIFETKDEYISYNVGCTKEQDGLHNYCIFKQEVNKAKMV